MAVDASPSAQGRNNTVQPSAAALENEKAIAGSKGDWEHVEHSFALGRADVITQSTSKTSGGRPRKASLAAKSNDGVASFVDMAFWKDASLVLRVTHKCGIMPATQPQHVGREQQTADSLRLSSSLSLNQSYGRSAARSSRYKHLQHVILHRITDVADPCRSSVSI